MPRKTELNDFAHVYYLLEGMCWTHFASKDKECRSLIEKRLSEWLFGSGGLMAQWKGSWFDFQFTTYPPEGTDLPMSRLYLRPGWHLAKSNGIMHCFLYYLNHIDNNPALRACTDLGLKYLSHPLKARMTGVATELDESYGKFADQATGFACLSLADAVSEGAVFNLAGTNT